MKRDCPKLKKQADEKRDDLSKSANVAQNDSSDSSDGDMLSVSTNQFVDAWILDSGCSYHITPNREWFTSYRSGNFGFIYLGDDRCCNIVGVGDVRIKTYDGTVRTLCDVRHIPDLKKNRISLGTLHKNGFIPKADEDRETIRSVKGALTVMKGKITAGNIYKLLGSTVVGGVYSVDSCDDNTKLWHMCLGHLSERGMTELHKRNLLHGVKSCKLNFCKFCVLEKQTKVSFMTGKHKTEGILDYVHSDVWGPTRESSLGGSLYYVTFTDDFSRKVWVYVLKQKSEVFAKFKLWKAEVENQISRKIKYLRSDNGTEYTDHSFRNFVRSMGFRGIFRCVRHHSKMVLQKG
ncbi:UNVERIFIED_CONTAM: Retrovirus-related Pol polyprotein from transposon TNT 1-94 [Sesamum latifolium]|uniref:Retrovirus-related Pol polyprotein from transposon TNT 1-94 n=1 Tax=Sesamum latifolium TaxID=2727402 RepID=A0AAW2X3G4_9LAMI